MRNSEIWISSHSSLVVVSYEACKKQTRNKMEEYDYGEESPKEKLSGEEDLESGFMNGYIDEEEVEECAECGSAIHEKKVVKSIGGETYVFCSEACAKEFEETLGEE